MLRTDIERPRTSWCGRRLGIEFHFLDAEHAALNGSKESRLVVCRHCLPLITDALRHGYEEGATTPE